MTDTTPADVLSACWARGERPALNDFLAATDPLSKDELAAVYHVDQWQRWHAGERPLVEEYLAQIDVPDDPEWLLEVVYGEVMLRRELGEKPALDEYQQRFPVLAERLRVQFEVGQALGTLIQPTPAVPAPEKEEPPNLPGYEILGVLGKGGMGVVYQARQLALNRVVALKVIRAGGELARFRAEAEAIARLQHPNIVQVFEVGECDGVPFMALEYCAGGSLEKVLGGKPLAGRVAAELVQTLARAVQAAHAAGVVHRDLKPANILLASAVQEAPETITLVESKSSQGVRAPGTLQWVIKVTDFGLARRLDVPGQTQSGYLLGTPAYMAPEQASGGTDIGPVADVWALGAILYECLTGRPPFHGATMFDLLRQVIADEPLPPSRLNAAVPRDLETIALKCLTKETSKRYASAAELADDLGRYLRGEPIHARPVSALERGVKWVRRRPTIAALSSGVVVVTLLGFAGVTWKWLGERSQRLRAEEAEWDADQRATAERTARQQAQTNLAFASVALARGEWQAGNADRALAALADCPEELRRWEWYHLRRLCQDDERTYAISAPPLLVPGGRFAAEPAGREGMILRDGSTGAIRARLRCLRPLTGALSGRWLVSASGPVLRVWDLSADDLAEKPRVLAQKGISWLNREMVAAAIDDAGAWLAVVVSAGLEANVESKEKEVKERPAEVRIWSVAEGRVHHTLPITASALALTPDGKQLITVGSVAQIWDVATGKETGRLAGASPRTAVLRFSRDGKLAAAGEEGVMVWPSISGRPTQLPGEQRGISTLAFSDDGTRLAVTGRERTVRVWDAIAGKELFALRGRRREAVSLAFTDKDRRLLIADAKTVAVAHATSGPAARRIGAKGEIVLSVHFRPDGLQLASAHGDGRVVVHDWPGGKLAYSLGEPQAARPMFDFSGLRFSPDSRVISVAKMGASKKGPELHLFAAADGRPLRHIAPEQMAIQGAAFSRDGTWLYTAGQDGSLASHHLAEARTVELAPPGKEPCTGLAHSRDGRWLAVTHMSFAKAGGARLFDLKTNQLVPTRRETDRLVSNPAFSPDDTLLAWAHAMPGAGGVVVWEIETGSVRHTLAGHVGLVTGLAFHPDGTRLATLDSEGTLHLWDMATGRLVISLPGPRDARGLAFSADGEHLARGLADGTVEVLDGRR